MRWLTFAMSCLMPLARGAEKHADSTISVLQPPEAAAPRPAFKAADLCTDPWAAVCESQPPPAVPAGITEDAIRRKALASYGSPEKNLDSLQRLNRKLSSEYLHFLSWDSPGTALLKEYSDFINRVQDTIMDEYNKRGITEDQILRRVEQIRSALAAQHAGQAKAAANIAGVTLQTPRNLRQAAGVALERLSDFYDLCGIDGLARQALYHKETGQLALCPGFLLHSLQQGGTLHELDFVLGHETGHSLGTGSDALPLKRYAAFAACLQQRHHSALRAPSEALSYLERTGLPALRAKLAQAEASPAADPEQALRLKRFVSISEAQLAESGLNALPQEQKSLAAFFKRPPDAGIGHADEILADAQASLVLAGLTARGTSDPKASVRAQLVYFCPYDPQKDELNRIKWGDPTEDGFHPPARFRLEYIMSSPTLRKALGCKAPPPRAWCEL